MLTALIDIAYLVAAILFIFGLKRLQSPATARRGNQLAAVGMLIAVVATLFLHDILTPAEMVGGLVLGGAIGAVLARKVEMTGMPELVAAFNGFGGLASALVAGAEVAKFITQHGEPAGAGEVFDLVTALTIGLSVLIGMVTFSGSFVAFGKLSGRVSGNPIAFPGMRVLTVLLALGALVGIGYTMAGAGDFPAVTEPVVYGTTGLMAAALLLGVLLVIPIGGADMPVVVALLNSYSGLAAAATGFVLDNTALIVSGALVGASGLILTKIMCVAMNRSLLNVLLGGFGGEALEGGGPAGALEGKTVHATTPEDVAILLSYAQQVIIVPGYGMAVAQAQHQVRELAELLQEKGVTVKFAIHPVAGRMPGHMNVLLAEANVPYDQLFEMDEINGEFDNTDVALVIGANDVVNPAARHDKSSPIYGMPILNVDHARTAIVLKRSMRPGYAGIENELFYNENTQMLFGDAKESLTKLIAEVKALS
ncbi:NAD(P)(+) transhydrogenase (Re/Si-specific) subunit beta [Rhodocaloribacter litoris]|uniref:NAD(P)(+) transhydrogenase (Re/Si-specific) subunit beta n=1 Tax=Rhodocaloribacter litoris TaxID=2558931 RepID=UPI00141F3D42|nr:NAD(P)(+) transhydrogenase (Re/Si-specific) subunit beta [Rhodocaloribacter litoris]QXD14820.1 NAD(P)(+) transhydrogenase (Re/Si-specific) subunit beta [Rhodocaloribacter litoris]GIV59089.1 MAG: NAD(P) transhydrogenase subunit beta [Rhodothermaceae bacterium]